MQVKIELEALSATEFAANVIGVSAASAHGPTPEEAVEEAMERTSWYLDPKEPEFISFLVTWTDGRPFLTIA